MRKSGLITNAKAGEGSFSKFICNLLPKACRVEMLEGREHIVVPMVMLTEGVHNGSQGSLLYTADELGKTPESWNHKPIVVYHPTMNGQGISACQPDVINTRKVGVMMNTKLDGKRLVAEAWIEKVRADAVDSRIMDAITKQEMMELSTGVFVDNDTQGGTWNGEAYVGVAKNFRPDHLALLPDQIGACSIQDGAGFLRNSANPKERSAVLSFVKSIFRKAGLVSNEMSFSNIRETLCDALRARFAPNSGSDMMGPMLWVEDVYSNFVIYELDSKLYRLGYTATQTGVTLSEDAPVEVVRVTEYRTASGSFVGNRETSQPQQKDTMNKTELVNRVLAVNKAWTETDRKTLEAMSEAQLQSLIPAAPAAATPAVNVQTPAVAAQTPVANSTPAAPAKSQTVDEYIATAPEGFREVLRNGLASVNRQREEAITTIAANTEAGFTREELAGKTLDELQKLAKALAPKPVANYAGQAAVPAANASKEEPLALPTMTFTK